MSVNGRTKTLADCSSHLDYAVAYPTIADKAVDWDSNQEHASVCPRPTPVSDTIYGMRYVALTEGLLPLVEDWFDDPETTRFLYGRQEIRREIELMRTMPGTEFRGAIILSRHDWIFFQKEKAVGFLGVEMYENGTASLVFVVAPDERGKGIGTRILSYLNVIPEIKSAEVFVGGVEPENIASIRSLVKAGFAIGAEPDEEGLLSVRKDR